MGPSAIRYAGLHERLHRLGYETLDGGNIPVPQIEEMPQPNKYADKAGVARHLPQVAQVMREVYQRSSRRRDEEEIVIFLGGDHSISIGTIAAMTERGKIGVLWVDAHGDINTPDSSPSGNIHGMPVAVLLGHGAPELVDIGVPGPKIYPHQLGMIGIRDLDPMEKVRLANDDMAVFTMRDLDRVGMADAAGQILDRFTEMDFIHVSFDADVLDPSVAPGVGTPVPGGLSYREAHLLMELLADSGKVRSLDITEVNPILDAGNVTAEIAVEMAASLLGQRIL